MFIYERNARVERAEQKAKAVRPHVTVNSFGDYLVEGSQTIYSVLIGQAEGGLAIDCNCLAGQNEKPCYHAAAAYMRHLQLASSAPARDRNLSIIAHDLNFISRRAACAINDSEIAQEIEMAVRSALQALSEFDVSQQPAWLGQVA